MLINGCMINDFGVLTQYVGKAETLRIPDTVKRIGDGAFYKSRIKWVHVPGNVVSIGKQAFRDCPNLTDVILDEGCTEIDDYAFWTKTMPPMRRFTLPASLKKIGKYVFYPQEYEYNLQSEEEILYDKGEFVHRYCEITTPYNPLVIQYAIPYQDMSVKILVSEAEALAEFNNWLAAETALCREGLTSAERGLSRAQAKVKELRNKLWDAKDTLDGLRGLFKKKEREAQERKIGNILQELEKAEEEIPRCERHVAREKEALKSLRTAPREKQLSKCRDWLSAKKTASARGVLIRGRNEHVEKRLERQRAEETRRALREHPWYHIPLLDETPLTSSGWTAPDHGPLATAENCGMPHIDVSDM